jgi:hypothetical protein
MRDYLGSTAPATGSTLQTAKTIAAAIIDHTVAADPAGSRPHDRRWA